MIKRAAIWTAVLLIAFTGGTWFGFQWRNPPIDWDISVSFTCGRGDYPTEAFRMVNDEVSSKIDSLLGEHASQQLFVTVIPNISGYRIRAAGDSDSALFREPARSQLTDWIGQRMDELLLKEQQAEAGTGQPATRSQLNWEGSDKPQPEAEGSSR